MGDLTLKGATSGQITLTPTGVAGTNTLTLPAKTGNIITSADSGTVTQAMLASNVAGNGPAFRAYVNGAQTISNSTFTKLPMNTKSGSYAFDTSGSFDATTNYRFTAPVAGYYQISGQCAFTGSASGYVQLAIRKNGNDNSYGNSAPNNTAVGGQVVISDLVYLAVNDYVELWCWQNSGGSLNTQNSSSQNFFCGAFVRSA